MGWMSRMNAGDIQVDMIPGRVFERQDSGHDLDPK